MVRDLLFRCEMIGCYSRAISCMCETIRACPGRLLEKRSISWTSPRRAHACLVHSPPVYKG